MATEPIQETVAATAGSLPPGSDVESRQSGIRKGFWPALIFYVAIGFFLINLIAMVSTVVLDSLGQEWFTTWLPKGLFTMQWYAYEQSDHDIVSMLVNTLIVAVGATVLAILVGFPAAYVLARKQFRFKNLL